MSNRPRKPASPKADQLDFGSGALVSDKTTVCVCGKSGHQYNEILPQI